MAENHILKRSTPCFFLRLRKMYKDELGLVEITWHSWKFHTNINKNVRHWEILVFCSSSSLLPLLEKFFFFLTGLSKKVSLRINVSYFPWICLVWFWSGERGEERVGGWKKEKRKFVVINISDVIYFSSWKTRKSFKPEECLQEVWAAGVGFASLFVTSYNIFYNRFLARSPNTHPKGKSSLNHNISNDECEWIIALPSFMAHFDPENVLDGKELGRMKKKPFLKWSINHLVERDGGRFFVPWSCNEKFC